MKMARTKFFQLMVRLNNCILLLNFFPPTIQNCTTFFVLKNQSESFLQNNLKKHFFWFQMKKRFWEEDVYFDLATEGFLIITNKQIYKQSSVKNTY